MSKMSYLLVGLFISITGYGQIEGEYHTSVFVPMIKLGQELSEVLYKMGNSKIDEHDYIGAINDFTKSLM